VCAAIEAVMPGLGDPATGRLLAPGVRPAFGIDVEVAASGDMFNVMRTALAAHNLLAARERDYGAQIETPTPNDLLAFATIDGAGALGLENIVGSLTPGKKADVILLDGTAPNLARVTDPASSIVAAAQPANVDTVLVDGKVLKRDGRLVGVDFESVAQRAASSRARLLTGETAGGAEGRDAMAALADRH
jgi:cytosine/adenosine deaminase-related metal-dependent hydrolase